MSLLFAKLDERATIPTRATKHSAGWDLYALESKTISYESGSVIIPTGIAVRLPKGHYGRIAMRSGLAVKQHLSVSAGVIDFDYTGPIGVVTYTTKPNHSYTVEAGERFAQIIIEKCHDGPSTIVDVIPPLDAEVHDGFGSTGSR